MWRDVSGGSASEGWIGRCVERHMGGSFVVLPVHLFPSLPPPLPIPPHPATASCSTHPPTGHTEHLWLSGLPVPSQCLRRIQVCLAFRHTVPTCQYASRFRTHSIPPPFAFRPPSPSAPRTTDIGRLVSSPHLTFRPRRTLLRRDRITRCNALSFRRIGVESVEV